MARTVVTQPHAYVDHNLSKNQIPRIIDGGTSEVLMETHERNVLMWLASYWDRFSGWLVPISWIVLSALLLAGCASLPTAATAHTPKEIMAQSFADCHCRYHKVPNVTVNFVDHKRVDGALAWGWAGVITVVRSELETWAMVDIEMVIGHEVAHAALGVWDEEEATKIASDTYYAAGCH